MSQVGLNLNNEEEGTSYRKAKRYQFNSSFISETLNKSSSKKSIIDHSFNRNNNSKHPFSFKELEPKDLFHHKLMHSKSTKSISTSATATNDQSVIMQRPVPRPNNSYINLSNHITPVIIETTTKDIKKRVATLHQWVHHVEENGFEKYKSAIERKARRKEAIMLNNSGINDNIKAVKVGSKNVFLSNGRIAIETSTYKQRALSQMNCRINPNQIITMKVDMPKYSPQAARLNKQRDLMKKEAKRLQEVTEKLKQGISATTLLIAEQTKENESIRKEITFFKKKIISMKEKVYFCFDSNNKFMQNAYTIVKDKTLYPVDD